jgi:hypothetical protein
VASSEKMESEKNTKARLYSRYPLSSVLIYNGTTIFHFLLELGYAGYSRHGLIYLRFLNVFLRRDDKITPYRGFNCVYTRAKDWLCISGLNVISKKMAKEGDLKAFPRRAQGPFCPNNLYLGSLIVPIVALIPSLIVNFSVVLLLIFLAVMGLLLFRFFILFPRIACLHCRAKYECPQAGAMGVRNR